MSEHDLKKGVQNRLFDHDILTKLQYLLQKSSNEAIIVSCYWILINIVAGATSNRVSEVIYSPVTNFAARQIQRSCNEDILGNAIHFLACAAGESIESQLYLTEMEVQNDIIRILSSYSMPVVCVVSDLDSYASFTSSKTGDISSATNPALSQASSTSAPSSTTTLFYAPSSAPPLSQHTFDECLFFLSNISLILQDRPRYPLSIQPQSLAASLTSCEAAKTLTETEKRVDVLQRALNSESAFCTIERSAQQLLRVLPVASLFLLDSELDKFALLDTIKFIDNVASDDGKALPWLTQTHLTQIDHFRKANVRKKIALPLYFSQSTSTQPQSTSPSHSTISFSSSSSPLCSQSSSANPFQQAAQPSSISLATSTNASALHPTSTAATIDTSSAIPSSLSRSPTVIDHHNHTPSPAPSFPDPFTSTDMDALPVIETYSLPISVTPLQLIIQRVIDFPNVLIAKAAAQLFFSISYMTHPTISGCEMLMQSDIVTLLFSMICSLHEDIAVDALGTVGNISRTQNSYASAFCTGGLIYILCRLFLNDPKGTQYIIHQKGRKKKESSKKKKRSKGRRKEKGEENKMEDDDGDEEEEEDDDDDDENESEQSEESEESEEIEEDEDGSEVIVRNALPCNGVLYGKSSKTNDDKIKILTKLACPFDEAFINGKILDEAAFALDSLSSGGDSCVDALNTHHVVAVVMEFLLSIESEIEFHSPKSPTLRRVSVVAVSKLLRVVLRCVKRGYQQAEEYVQEMWEEKRAMLLQKQQKREAKLMRMNEMDIVERSMRISQYTQPPHESKKMIGYSAYTSKDNGAGEILSSYPQNSLSGYDEEINDDDDDEDDPDDISPRYLASPTAEDICIENTACFDLIETTERRELIGILTVSEEIDWKKCANILFKNYMKVVLELEEFSSENARIQTDRMDEFDYNSSCEEFEEEDEDEDEEEENLQES
ncbi:uncharacterized protein MONOS_12992 [Monocercomonoides exilis]|uniref:uncharacterized protein n=1 Tax=Monocercomonoides exilis TaxID=2049356 RepID=UPI00355A7860|nr:hypothetical protein MONOS_12992 [Monocercomonoides exilis]|eukprot:MONOS_12992.1-p1 / transcript=MONOS_12992.1 / gene=MONOS_12992 / organism=Monocercomonoides_exilis_PA203 / gene_product=unspecified product / transcript_product=unspecified product / location=Mono_scaffold00764:3148-6353(-) / protein_length=948 / sequence_SO=supercontig / SO=protein_coding / is_pseudo=false